MEEEYDYLLKLVVVGDSSVGKSKLIMRYVNDDFDPTSHTTIGAELSNRCVEVGGQRVKAQIWDTAGMEKHKALTSNYYRGAVGVLLVYDISKAATFINVVNWLAEAMRHVQGGVSFVLAANKADLTQREVSAEEGQEFAEKHGLEYIETSALDRTNVEKAFNHLMQKALELGTESRQPSVLDSPRKARATKSKCC
jgi:Ras-related protein Rab-11A